MEDQIGKKEDLERQVKCELAHIFKQQAWAWGSTSLMSSATGLLPTISGGNRESGASMEQPV